MKHLLIILSVFVASLAMAQCPGPSVRTALITLQKSALVEGTLAGQIPLTDVCGNQRYGQYTEIELVPVGFTPTSTGNTSNLSEFVTDPSGDIYYIDWQGNGLKLNGGGGGSFSLFANQGVTVNGTDTVQLGNKYTPGTGITKNVYQLRTVVLNRTDGAWGAIVLNDLENGGPFRVVSAFDSTALKNAINGSGTTFSFLTVNPNVTEMQATNATDNCDLAVAPTLYQVVRSTVGGNNSTFSQKADSIFLHTEKAGAIRNDFTIRPDSTTDIKRIVYVNVDTSTFTDNTLITKKYLLAHSHANTLQEVTTAGNTTNNKMFITGTGTLSIKTADTSSVVNIETSQVSGKNGIAVVGKNFAGTSGFKFWPQGYTGLPNFGSFNINGQVFPGVNLPYSTRPNYVFNAGYNYATNATNENPHEVAMGFGLETYYQQAGLDSGLEGFSEFHLRTTDTLGVEDRFISKATPWNGKRGVDVLGLNSDNLVYNDFVGSPVWQMKPLQNLWYFTDTINLYASEPRGFALTVQNGANTSGMTIFDFNNTDTLEIGRTGLLSAVKIHKPFIIQDNTIRGAATSTQIDIGTSTIKHNLFINAFQNAGLTLKGGASGRAWSFEAGGSAMALIDVNSGGTPVYFYNSSGSGDFIFRNANLGVGGVPGFFPEAKLHLYTASGATAKMQRIENSTGTTDIYRSTATPEGAITANPGDIAHTSISSTGGLWVKETGTGNLGWRQFLTTSYEPSVFVAGPIKGSGTSLLPLDILNESIDSSRLKNGGISRKDITPAPGLTVMARDSNSTGYLKYLPLTADQVLRVNSAGTVLGGGAVNLASSAAVTGTLPTTNLNTTSTTNGVIIQQGNSLGAQLIIGTNDANGMAIETQNITRMGITTAGVISEFASTATTSAAVTVVTSALSTSGTAANNLGSRYQSLLQTSSGNSRIAGSVGYDWAAALDASHTSRYIINGVSGANGAVSETEMWRMEAATTPVMKIASAMGAAGSTAYANASITPGVLFTIGGNAQTVQIGTNTGLVNVTSQASNVAAINLEAPSNTTTNSVSFGTTAFGNTSGTKYGFRWSQGYTVASGTGNFYNNKVDGTFNQTVTTAKSGFFDVAPVLTNIAGGWAFINCATSVTGSQLINSTGTLMTSTHVGPFGFGSTTTPTDKVEVTGNIALMTAGNKLKIATGSNASLGTSTLVAGTVTVNTTAVATGSTIMVCHNATSGTPGILSYGSIVNATSFVINSTNAADTSTVNWWIIN